MRTLLALTVALILGTPAHSAGYCENFSSYAASTDLNSVSGWYSAGTGSWTADNSATFGSMAGKQISGGGAWYQTEYRGGWTDIDLTARFSNPYYVSVRQQNLTGIFSPGYYVKVNSGSSISLGKMCGGSNFDAVTATVSISTTDVTLRIVMSGYVMSVYTNGTLVAVHDFTGNVFCSNAAYASGGLGFQFIGATTYVDNIVVNGGTCDSVSPRRNLRLKDDLRLRLSGIIENLLNLFATPAYAQPMNQRGYGRLVLSRQQAETTERYVRSMRTAVARGDVTRTATPTAVPTRGASPTPTPTPTPTFGTPVPTIRPSATPSGGR